VPRIGILTDSMHVWCRMGNGINWKGQVFPALGNYTAHNRMTGVGNALKRHYLLYLADYEQARAGLFWLSQHPAPLGSCFSRVPSSATTSSTWPTTSRRARACFGSPNTLPRLVFVFPEFPQAPLPALPGRLRAGARACAGPLTYWHPSPDSQSRKSVEPVSNKRTGFSFGVSLTVSHSGSRCAARRRTRRMCSATCAASAPAAARRLLTGSPATPAMPGCALPKGPSPWPRLQEPSCA
jgi:hypothetical protein